MKLITSARIIRAAEKLHEIQDRKRRLMSELRTLNEDEAFYSRLLELKVGSNFEYPSDYYQKVVKFKEFDRLIVDQRKVKRLLGNKTPYRTTTIKSVKVDYKYI